MAFVAREVIAGKDARTLANDVLAMDDEQFRAAFKKSPIKRAKRAGLQRNATVVLRNRGTSEDVQLHTRSLDDSEKRVGERSMGTLARSG